MDSIGTTYQEFTLPWYDITGVVECHLELAFFTKVKGLIPHLNRDVKD